MKVEDYKLIEKIIFNEIHRQTKKRKTGFDYKLIKVGLLLQALNTCESCVNPESLSWYKLNNEPDWDEDDLMEED